MKQTAINGGNVVDNVIRLDCITSLDIPADTVLEEATNKLKGVFIAGYTHEGEEYFASSIADGGEVLWLLERCKQELMK